MSKTNSLHYDLCVEGAKWLRRRQNYDRCKAKKDAEEEQKKGK